MDVQRIQEVGTAVDDDSIKIRGMGARRIRSPERARCNSSGVAGGYFIDWTMIPLAGAERIEVVKGVGDPRYGNVLGGVINLVSKRLRTDAPGTEIQASGASFGTASFNLSRLQARCVRIFRDRGIHPERRLPPERDENLAGADLHLGYDLRGKAADGGRRYTARPKGIRGGEPDMEDFGDPNYAVALIPDSPATDGEIMYGGMGATADRELVEEE